MKPYIINFFFQWQFIKPKKQNQKAKCYKPLSHLEKAKLCWCYFAPSLLPQSLSKLAQVIAWLEWQQSSGRSRRVPRLGRFKDLIMFQINVLLQLRGRCWKQSTCVAWHPARTRRLFSVPPSSLQSINPPVPFNQRKTSLICASGSLVTGNWILQISLKSKGAICKNFKLNLQCKCTSGAFTYGHTMYGVSQIGKTW